MKEIDKKREIRGNSAEGCNISLALDYGGREFFESSILIKGSFPDSCGQAERT